MFEHPRRGRQARNFTTNVLKILDLKSSSEQIFSENCRWVSLMFYYSPVKTINIIYAVLIPFISISREHVGWNIYYFVLVAQVTLCTYETATKSKKPRSFHEYDVSDFYWFYFLLTKVLEIHTILLSCQILRGLDEKRGQMPRHPSSPSRCPSSGRSWNWLMHKPMHLLRLGNKCGVKIINTIKTPD